MASEPPLPPPASQHQNLPPPPPLHPNTNATTSLNATKKIVTQRITKPSKSKFTPSLLNRTTKLKNPDATVEQQTVITQPPTSIISAQCQPRQLPLISYDEQENISLTITQSPTTTLTSFTTITTPSVRRRGAEKKNPSSLLISLPSSNSSSSASSTTTKSSSQKIMKHFLRDNGEGIPMQNSSSPKRNKRRKEGGDHPFLDGNLTLNSIKNSSISTTITPRVRIGADGEIVMDDDISSHHHLPPPSSTSSLQSQSIINMNVIHEGGQTGRHLTSHAFVKGMDSNRWNPAQTEEFYSALSVCGTDFTLLSLLIKDKRTREQIKGKFKVEERKNPNRISMALKNRRKMTIDIFEVNGYNRDNIIEGNVNDLKDEIQERRPGRPKQEEVGILSAVTSSSLSGSPRKKKVVAPPVVIDDKEIIIPPPSPPSPLRVVMVKTNTQEKEEIVKRKSSRKKN